MQSTSDIYKRILARDDYVVRRMAVVDGVEYTDETGLVSVSKQHRLYVGTGPGVGGTAAAEYDLVLHTDNVLPRLSRIELFVSLVGGGEQSEWTPVGTGFSDTRKRDKIRGEWHVTGFDALLLAEQLYIPTGAEPGEWPRACADVVADICQRIGLPLDPRTLLMEYEVGFPGELTMRSILGEIAAMHMGNWTVTNAGMLYLAPLVPEGEAQDLSDHMSSLLTGTEFAPFSRVQFLYDDKVIAQAGDETGRTLTAECQWATQQMADDALASVQSFVYRPFEAVQAVFDPAMELGDPVSVDGTQSVLAALETDFDLLFTADIAAPAEDAVESDFPFVNKPQAKMKSDIANNQAMLWTGIDQADHLSTSQKIAKYLREDTSEDDFLRIQGLGITWIRARTDGTEEQATDEDGHPLYWDPDVEKATVEADGWYYVGTEKVKPTIVETPYPVMCYAYEEQVIAQWKFVRSSNASGETVFFPTISMGAGYGAEEDPERGKGVITKHEKEFSFLLKNSEGKLRGMVVGDKYTDIYGTRKPNKITVRDYRIQVDLQGDVYKSYDFDYDENGNLVGMIDGDDHYTELDFGGTTDGA